MEEIEKQYAVLDDKVLQVSFVSTEGTQNYYLIEGSGKVVVIDTANIFSKEVDALRSLLYKVQSELEYHFKRNRYAFLYSVRETEDTLMKLNRLVVSSISTARKYLEENGYTVKKED